MGQQEDTEESCPAALARNARHSHDPQSALPLADQRRVGHVQRGADAPPCNGQLLAEGFTYLFLDPHRGEIVMFRARARELCALLRGA